MAADNPKWKDNLKKGVSTPGARMILVTVSAVVVLAAVFGLSLSEGRKEAVSVPEIPRMNAAANGGQKDNETYQKTVIAGDARHAEDAKGKGESFAPTIDLPKAAATPAPAATTPVATTSEAAAAEQQAEEQRRQAREHAEQLRQQAEQQAEARRDAWRQAMQNEALILNNRWQVAPPGMITVSSPVVAAATASTTTGAATTATSAAAVASGPLLARAGRTAIARNGLVLDTDHPGTPLMLTIVSGEPRKVEDGISLKDAVLSGTTQVVDGYFVGKLTEMITVDGKKYAINAIMIDPDTNDPAMDDVRDPRLFERYGLLIGAKFLQGASTIASNAGTTTLASGNAVSTSNGTTITPSANIATTTAAASAKQALYGGLASMTQQIGTDIAEAAPKGPRGQIFVNSGVGVMFLSNATVPSAAGQAAGTNSATAPLPLPVP